MGAGGDGVLAEVVGGEEGERLTHLRGIAAHVGAVLLVAHVLGLADAREKLHELADVHSDIAVPTVALAIEAPMVGLAVLEGHGKVVLVVTATLGISVGGGEEGGAGVLSRFSQS